MHSVVDDVDSQHHVRIPENSIKVDLHVTTEGACVVQRPVDKFLTVFNAFPINSLYASFTRDARNLKVSLVRRDIDPFGLWPAGTYNTKTYMETRCQPGLSPNQEIPYYL